MNKDYKEILSKLKKYQTLFIILIPIFLAIFFRAYTYDLPFAEDSAQSQVENSIRNNLEAQILAEYPDISQTDLETVVNKNYNEVIVSQADEIALQEEQLANNIREYFQDENGQTYLLAIDPYYYLRQAQNIEENGHVGDEIRDGELYNNHMYAPNGKVVYNSLHPFMIFYTYKIMSIFGNPSMMEAAFIVPLIISTLAIIPCFFITRRLVGNAGAFFSSVVLATNVNFLGRTPAGFSDTDAYNVFFPLTIVWLYIESFKAKKVKNKLTFAGLAGLTTGLYSLAWGGWWYIFDFILAATGIYFLVLLYKYQKDIFKVKRAKTFIRNSLVYIISTAITVSLIKGFSTLRLIVLGPLGATFLNQAAKPSLWPNVYTTVAELNNASLSGIINSMGGTLLFVLSLAGIIMLNLGKYKLTKLKYALLFLIWFLGTIYASTKGMRFILLMVPVFSIGIGITAGTLYRKIKKWSIKDLEVNKVMTTLVLIGLMIVPLVPLVKEADKVAKSEIPSMNDAWFETLTNIKENTPEDAIVNSWWDFGHWFKTIADRAVTFDGASQNTPQAHWIGKVLLTDNEEEAVGILRMLDCGANDAYNLIIKETGDQLQSIDILYKLFQKNRNEARTVLEGYNLDSEKILEKTHCDPPENYFITSEDMVSKSGVWAHFGSWDFTKAYIYDTVKNKEKEDTVSFLTENLSYSEEEANNLYYEVKGLSESQSNEWIAPYPRYGSIGTCNQQNGAIVCSNGVYIDESQNIAAVTAEEGLAQAKYYVTENNLYEYSDANDMAIAYNKQTSTAVIMDSALRESIFTKLYFFEGSGLNKFSGYIYNRGVDGFRIYVWKVNF